MRAIGRFACELLGVWAAGFVGFFVMLAYTAGFLIWFACGLACVGFLLVALFSMVMWCPRTMHTRFGRCWDTSSTPQGLLR
jgi:hypothetical protein